jgi:hypothetical protein
LNAVLYDKPENKAERVRRPCRGLAAKREAGSGANCARQRKVTDNFSAAVVVVVCGVGWWPVSDLSGRFWKVQWPRLNRTRSPEPTPRLRKNRLLLVLIVPRHLAPDHKTRIGWISGCERGRSHLRGKNSRDTTKTEISTIDPVRYCRLPPRRHASISEVDSDLLVPFDDKLSSYPAGCCLAPCVSPFASSVHNS